MRTFLKRCGEFCIPLWPLLVVVAAIITVFLVVIPAHAQTVCTYTEQSGAVRSCNGSVQLNQIRTINNQSGAITAAATSQTVFAANPARQFLYVANPTTATEPLYVNFGTAASATNSIVLQPGGIVQFVAGVTPVTTITVSAATAGHAYVAMEGN